MEKKTFGEWLRERREAKNLSQQDVGNRVNNKMGKAMGRANIRKYESGDNIPDILMFPRLVRAVEGDIVEALVAAGIITQAQADDLDSTRVLEVFQDIDPSMRPTAIDVLAAIRSRHTETEDVSVIDTRKGKQSKRR